MRRKRAARAQPPQSAAISPSAPSSPNATGEPGPFCRAAANSHPRPPSRFRPPERRVESFASFLASLDFAADGGDAAPTFLGDAARDQQPHFEIIGGLRRARSGRRDHGGHSREIATYIGHHDFHPPARRPRVSQRLVSSSTSRFASLLASLYFAGDDLRLDCLDIFA